MEQNEGKLSSQFCTLASEKLASDFHDQVYLKVLRCSPFLPVTVRRGTRKRSRCSDHASSGVRFALATIHPSHLLPCMIRVVIRTRGWYHYAHIA